MSEYNRTPLARMMIDDRTPMDRTLDLAENIWHQRRKVYFDLDDPQLSLMHKSILEQIANQRYGRRKRDFK